MFDWKKPTVQMLGRWQPFHDGHYTLFKEIIKKTWNVRKDRYSEERNPSLSSQPKVEMYHIGG